MVAASEPDWRGTVTVRLREDLRPIWAPSSGAEPTPRTVRVTELLDVRMAFYRRRHPVTPSTEQQNRWEEGRDLHAQLGPALATGLDNLEVRVRREGIVGQIDLVEQVPIELKTTSSLPAVTDLATTRPQYVEQLAMYCALAENPQGRLLVVQRQEGRAVDGLSVDVTFRELGGVWAEMQRRADRLREAERTGDPAALPRCSWRGRGCEFEAAGVCACSGNEPSASPLGVDVLERFEPDEPGTHRLRERIGQLPESAPVVVRRYSDLLFPRRAYFQRLAPPSEGGAPAWAPPPARDELYRRIIDRLEAGPSGSLTRRLGAEGPVPDPVSCWNGDPYLIKVTGTARRPTADSLLAGQPHYFLELGLRCAAVGASRGWLILGLERAPDPGQAILPFEVGFGSPGPLAEIAHARERSLRAALAGAPPQGLPPCPAWMYRDCPYRERCGCGATDVPPNR